MREIAMRDGSQEMIDRDSSTSSSKYSEMSMTIYIAIDRSNGQSVVLYQFYKIRQQYVLTKRLTNENWPFYYRVTFL